MRGVTHECLITAQLMFGLQASHHLLLPLQRSGPTVTLTECRSKLPIYKSQCKNAQHLHMTDTVGRH